METPVAIDWYSSAQPGFLVDNSSNYAKKIGDAVWPDRITISEAVF